MTILNATRSTSRLAKALTVILISVGFGSGANAEPFIFTAIPDQDETQLQQRFGKVATYLEKNLKVDVKYIPVKSYTSAVTAFRNNQVQLAWFGGLSGVQARRLVPDSNAIAQGIEDQFFKSYIIAHHSTHLKPQKTLSDKLANMTFTFGSKGSTSGRLMPEFYLREHFKQSPNELFKSVGFSGDHSRTIALVQSGAYQLGAVNYKVWDKGLADGKIDTSKVSIIWETPNYPDYQWTIRGDVDAKWGQGFSQKVKQALLDIKDPEILNAFPREGFVPASNSDYQPILDTAKSIGIID
ncbi:putative selenate ABC transporter substrate-binding protein [Alkalimarinus sediminis]|uniref:Selenate ABC transporter substrate-binding protein n=1 Tax=Alkalimarinus sediminis TaxID=1632866 RepID=A0A9E8HG28_9ALTE|nr:putative selenate ABC transporter substrate-binding protein [Alkalimarinus sediminis]UZW73993.1 putative selenate ABC transporter substrate-binding protein [Alkalimarinus sediminis]